MSRMRQIPVMDITQRERIMQQNQPAGLGGNTQSTGHPPMHNTARPVQMSCRPKNRKAPAPKFRLSDTPALIAGGCSSMREFCNSVQNITMDLNNLIGSVESMVPLLNTYLTVLQSRSIATEPELEPPIEVSTAGQTHTVPNHAQQSQAPMSAPIPKPEDIQTLLENPFVRNLLNGVMQSGAFPNANMTRENAPHS